MKKSPTTVPIAGNRQAAPAKQVGWARLGAGEGGSVGALLAFRAYARGRSGRWARAWACADRQRQRSAFLEPNAFQQKKFRISQLLLARLRVPDRARVGWLRLSCALWKRFMADAALSPTALRSHPASPLDTPAAPGGLMEGLPADGPALTETEQEGWANLGLQPPAQLEPLLEEQ